MLAFCLREGVRQHTLYELCLRYLRLCGFKPFRAYTQKSALIRHGITSNDLTELHYPNARVDILVCSAVPEYESMVKNYGHP